MYFLFLTVVANGFFRGGGNISGGGVVVVDSLVWLGVLMGVK